MNEYMPPVQPGRSPRRKPASGGTSTGMPSLAICCDLALVPVAGVGEHDVGIAKSERGELALRGADHRLEVGRNPVTRW